MTSEQLQQYVDVALKQRDQFHLVFYPLTIVLSIGGAWLISYVREKGKNLATKEDIETITRKVESIKTELAAKQYFSQIRYEREVKVFEEIWPKLCELQEAALSLRPVMDSSPQEGETTESRKLKRAEKFTIAFTDFRTAIKHNRPFYPPTIWDELGKVLNLCWVKLLNSVFIPTNGSLAIIGKKPWIMQKALTSKLIKPVKQSARD